jgi:hypothetical protein
VPGYGVDPRAKLNASLRHRARGTTRENIGQSDHLQRARTAADTTAGYVPGAAVSLDLSCILIDWDAPRGGVCARLIRDHAGAEQVQMRIEMGVLQMHPSGRPDGARHHGHPTALAHIQHEQRIDGEIGAEEWDALQREFQQFNYRRLAYAALAETAIQTDDAAAAIDLLHRTVSDIEHCIATLRLVGGSVESGLGPNAAMLPALLFNRTRLRVRRLALEARFEEAIDEAVDGLAELDQALIEIGFDDEQRGKDPGMAFLRQTESQLRQKHGIAHTLRERLQQAVATENFPLAAELQNEIRRRKERKQPNRPGPQDS